MAEKKKVKKPEDEIPFQSDEDIGQRFRDIESELGAEPTGEEVPAGEIPGEELPGEELPAEAPAMVHTPAEFSDLAGKEVGDRIELEITNIDGENYTLSPVAEEEAIEEVSEEVSEEAIGEV